MKKFLKSKFEEEQRAEQQGAVLPPLPPLPPFSPPQEKVKQDVVDYEYEDSERAEEPPPEPATSGSYRPDMCKNFVRGTCTRGSSCIYAHKLDLMQLNGVYRFCRDFANRGCMRPVCKFVHATTWEKESFMRTGVLPPHLRAPAPRPPPPPPPAHHRSDLSGDHTPGFPNIFLSWGAEGACAGVELWGVLPALDTPPPPPPLDDQLDAAAPTRKRSRIRSTSLSSEEEQRAEQKGAVQPPLPPFSPPRVKQEVVDYEYEPPHATAHLRAPAAGTPPPPPPPPAHHRSDRKSGDHTPGFANMPAPALASFLPSKMPNIQRSPLTGQQCSSETDIPSVSCDDMSREYVGRRQKRRLLASPPATSDDTAAASLLSELRKEFAGCISEMREFWKEMGHLRESFSAITARLDSVEGRIEALERRQAECETGGTAELEHTISQLRLELNDRDQEALLSDLELSQLPEEKGENVVHTVSVLAVRLGVTLEDRDIVFAERVGAPARESGGRPRRIVVRLARCHLRDELLRAAQMAVRRSVAAGVDGDRVYVNERLTRPNRQLFHRAREECRKLQ